MCVIWVTESSEFYSSYESDLIREQHKDAVIEEVSPQDVLRRISNESPDAIVLDNRLPFISGESVVDSVKRNSPDTKIIIVSSDRRGLNNIKSSVTTVLEKPLQVAQFLTVIGQVYNGM